MSDFSRKPRFKKGDFVTHILNNEQMLITYVHFVDYPIRRETDFWGKPKGRQISYFNGEYTVRRQDLTLEYFPEEELKITRVDTQLTKIYAEKNNSVV